ncbi:MAG: magnesium/cobalt transporter CorA, partial [Campylobacteraceae bacterium]|jgi:magnesium transporter|nr:magnesium/cobalt transporter CorA [Campylobacteraceae bacterium]
MIRYYLKDGNRLESVSDIGALKNDVRLQNIIWIDMLTPTISEIRAVEKLFNMKFPTKQESEEIEISSRYWEEGERIEINSYFLVNNDENPYNETVSFMLQDKLLISVRYKILKSFDDFTNKLFVSHKDLKDGFDIFTKIIDIRIDADADTIEVLAREITKVRRQVFADYVNEDEEMLEKISVFEDLNMKIRENVTDKQRILTSLLKSSKFPEVLKKEITIMLKDVRSLIEHTEFNFERLDYLQNIFLGTLSIEQNKVIKIFTIVNVIFLPPTLIASIYGMNFDLMPELHWKYGYLVAVFLMILSSVTPIWIFKKKGWM